MNYFDMPRVSEQTYALPLESIDVPEPESGYKYTQLRLQVQGGTVRVKFSPPTVTEDTGWIVAEGGVILLSSYECSVTSIIAESGTPKLAGVWT